MYASRHNRIDILQLLLAHPDIDVNISDSDGITPLLDAVCKNHIDIVQLLLQNPRTDINAQNNLGKTALIGASTLNLPDIVRLLLAHPDIDVNISDRDLFGNTPLWYAVYDGHIRIVQLLLEDSRTDVNAQNFFGSTALQGAAMKYVPPEMVNVFSIICPALLNIPHITKLLLEHPDIDVDLKDNDGHTALDIAQQRICRYSEITVLLSSHRAPTP